jgi:hypothetical protein
VDERYVVHMTAIDEDRNEFEDACDLDAPMKFRPFMANVVDKLRRAPGA